jgi:hypothetical protein
MKLTHNPNYAAKNRYSLPDEVELTYPAFSKALKTALDAAEKKSQK